MVYKTLNLRRTQFLKKVTSPSRISLFMQVNIHFWTLYWAINLYFLFSRTLWRPKSFNKVHDRIGYTRSRDLRNILETFSSSPPWFFLPRSSLLILEWTTFLPVRVIHSTSLMKCQLRPKSSHYRHPFSFHHFPFLTLLAVKFYILVLCSQVNESTIRF